MPPAPVQTWGPDCLTMLKRKAPKFALYHRALLSGRKHSKFWGHGACGPRKHASPARSNLARRFDSLLTVLARNRVERLEEPKAVAELARWNVSAVQYPVTV